jgi:hypothetical protein
MYRLYAWNPKRDEDVVGHTDEEIWRWHERSRSYRVRCVTTSCSRSAL